MLTSIALNLKLSQPLYDKVAVIALAILPVALVLFFQQLSVIALMGLCTLAVSYVVYRLGWSIYVALGFVICLYFSVELPIFGGAALSLPAEPIGVVLLIVAIIKLYHAPITSLKAWARQPIVWGVLSLVFIWLITTATSTMYLVSAKYVFINVLYIIIGAFLFVVLWLEDNSFLFKAFRILSFAALFFAIYAVYNLLPFGFNPGAAAIIALPFFKDHTIFGATFSMLIPVFFLWPYIVKTPKKTDWIQPIIGLIILLVVILSSSRGAWLALLVSSAFFGFVKLGGTLKHLLLITGIGALAIMFNLDKIESTFLANPYTSTAAEGGLQEQMLSVTNVNSDISNIERLNRWKCALRMASDKPLTGFGPGTYQFQYLPYQRAEDMTYISVTNPFNTKISRGGSAHSEYLLLLSESGILGLVAWVFLQLALGVTFFKLWGSDITSQEKTLVLAIYLGCLTFTVHSLVNNYLNTVQFGITWWMMVGALLALSLKHKNITNAA